MTKANFYFYRHKGGSSQYRRSFQQPQDVRGRLRASGRQPDHSQGQDRLVVVVAVQHDGERVGDHHQGLLRDLHKVRLRFF